MKMNMKIVGVVLGATLLAAVAFGQSVVRTAAPSHRAGFGMMGMMADYLDLTDAQRTQMKTILSKEKPTIQPLMQQLAAGRQQMQQLEQAATFDETKARTVATQQSQTLAELMVQKARIKSELIQVLTPDQKTKLTAFEARRQARWQKHLQGSTSSSEPASNQ
jgi:periplasmic protein CpxP/Spy